MLISNFLNSRKSIRDYKKKKIKDKDLKEIQKVLDSKNLGSTDYQFTVHGDGDRVYSCLDGHGGYGGVMIKAPGYIAMNVLSEDPMAHLKAAYVMEEIDGELQDLGMGTCWVTLLEASDQIIKDCFGNEKGHIKYLLAFGYPARTFSFGTSEFVPKMGVEEYVFKNLDKETYTMEELDNMGLADIFYYLRMAPSSKDKQPQRFVVDGKDIKLYAKDLESADDFMDMGIALYYFDQLAKASSITTHWEFDVKEEGDLTYIGKTSF